MNAKELYFAIGQIDDDLILDANAEHKKKRPVRIWAMAAAACLCIMFGGYMYFFGTYAVWNTGAAEYVSKVSIPESCAVQTLTAAEFEEYYRISLPDALGGLRRTAFEAQLYMDEDGTVLYDCNTFRYESADGIGTMNITVSRASAARQSNAEKISRIRGTRAALTENTSNSGYVLLGAAWEKGGTAVQASAEGMDKAEFISVLKELMK